MLFRKVNAAPTFRWQVKGALATHGKAANLARRQNENAAAAPPKLPTLPLVPIAPPTQAVIRALGTKLRGSQDARITPLPRRTLPAPRPTPQTGSNQHAAPVERTREFLIGLADGR